jgi:uncharacterized protein YecT (DUF1311 family)
MIFAFLVLAAAAADAGPPIDCKRDDLPQQEMNICAGREFEAADKALNEQWRLTSGAMRQMDQQYGAQFSDGRPSFFETLVDAQRAWIAFRDKNCTVQGYAFRGGSGESFMVSACMAWMTRERTDELKQLIEREK